MNTLTPSADADAPELVERLDPPDDFNFEHFRMRHMAAELLRTYHRSGIAPGSEAPPFDLEATDGTRLRLTDLRGKPVLLHFVSYTCPVTRGGVELMKDLHRSYGDTVQFVEVLVRQAHPGERHGSYTSFEQKLADARAYQQEESIEWPVAVDDLDGSVQRAYGGLAASAYLLDGDGRVAHYTMWGPTPALAAVIEDLLQGDRAAAAGRDNIDAVPHLAAAIVLGQGGPARGGRRSFLDLELGFPGAMLLMGVGRVIRPLFKSRLQHASTGRSTRQRRVIIGAITFAVMAFLCRRCMRSHGCMGGGGTSGCPCAPRSKGPPA